MSSSELPLPDPEAFGSDARSGLEQTSRAIDRAEFEALQSRVKLLEALVAGRVPETRSVAGETAPPPLEARRSVPPALIETPAAPPRESLENRLGSQVASRIGIVALLAGMAWFLKWAIDNEWLGPAERVLIGLTAGAGLVLWSERFRGRGYAPFSFALKAVGSGVLYLSLWAAFQLYHLVPASLALGAMLVVTAWNAWMAWVQDAELLGGYALLGGLLTPLLVSTGGDHETFLFTYLAAIDLSAVVLTRLKPWPRLLLLPLLATAAYFIRWYVDFFAGTEANASGQPGLTLLFLGIFFCIFASAAERTLQSPVSGPAQSLIGPVFVPLLNATFIGLAVYSVLEDAGHHEWLAWVALLFAGIYLGLVRLRRDPAAIAVHLSLAVVFLTIAIPLKLSTRFTTLGWLVEGVALLGSASRLETGTILEKRSAAIRALQVLAVAALAFGFLDLLSLPYREGSYLTPPFWNGRFGTALGGILVLGVATSVAGRASARPGSALWREIKLGCGIALSLAALEVGVTEIRRYWFFVDGGNSRRASDLSISAFLMIYGGGLLALGFWRRTTALRWQALLLLGVTIAKVFLYDVSGLSQGYRVASFLGLGGLLLGVSFVYQRGFLSLRDERAPTPEPDRSET